MERGCDAVLCYGKCWPNFLSESTFNKTNFWLIFFSFLWHKIIVLISNMFIYAKVGNSKFVEMHVDASDIYPSALVYYTRHRPDWVNITIYRTVYLHTDMCLQTLTHIQLKNKLWTTVAFLRCCNLIWGLANNNYSLYFLQFLTDSDNLRLCYIFIPKLYIVGPLSKLTETSFFCWRLHKYDLLQFVWYWITAQ